MIIITSIIATDAVVENKTNNGMLAIITEPFNFLLYVDLLGTIFFQLSLAPKRSSSKMSPYVIFSFFLFPCTLLAFSVQLAVFHSLNSVFLHLQICLYFHIFSFINLSSKVLP